MARTISQTINLQSSKEFSKYITKIDESGITIHPENYIEGGTANNYIQLQDGLEVFKEGISVANFGENVRVGIEDNNCITITPNNILIGQEESSKINISPTQQIFYHFDGVSRALTISEGKLMIPASKIGYHDIWSCLNMDGIYSYYNEYTNITRQLAFVGLIGGKTLTSWRTSVRTSDSITITTPLDSSTIYLYYQMAAGSPKVLVGVCEQGTTSSLNITASQFNFTLNYDGDSTFSHGIISSQYANSLSFYFEYLTSEPGGFINIGYRNDGTGQHSGMIGSNLETNYSNQFVIGKWNQNNTNHPFEIGGGNSGSNRFNALAITWDGNIEMHLDSSATSGVDYTIQRRLAALGWNDCIV